MKTYKFLPSEIKVMKTPPPMKVSEWASKSVVVQDGPFRDAYYKPEVNPYLVGIMDAFGDPAIEEVAVCGAPQTGKTLAMYACLGFSIDRRPGTKMLTMPDDKVARRVEAEKLRPLLKASPILNSQVSKMVSGHIRLKDGSSLFLSSSQSPAQRASITVRDLFMDEEDLYESEVGHGDPVTDFLERTQSYFFGRKIVRVSKPVGNANSSIWRAVTERASLLMAYEVPCPKCGEYQFFRESQVVAEPMGDREATPDEINRLRLGRYECPNCHKRWTDEDRDFAVASGAWRPSKVQESSVAGERVFGPGDEAPEVRSVGFHLPAILSWTVSLSALAADAKLAAASEDQEVKQAYANGRWARPFVPEILKADSDVILRRRDATLPARVAPHGTMALTCGIDTQKRGFYYAVVAWTPSLTKYLIDYGRLSGFDEVERLVFEQSYPVLGVDGKDVGDRIDIWRAAIDSGGTSGEGIYSRTEEVYEFARWNGGGRLFAAKGVGYDQTPAVRWANHDRMPGSQKVIPGGLQLYLIDTAKMKSSLFASILSEDSSRPFYMYGYDPEKGEKEERHKELIAHLLAEKLIRKPDGKTKWELVSRDNHYLDCLALALACGHVSWTPSLDHMRKNLEYETRRSRENRVERAPIEKKKKPRAW
jgi:phage terminase large subunit GpA-like protein